MSWAPSLCCNEHWCCLILLFPFRFNFNFESIRLYEFASLNAWAHFKHSSFCFVRFLPFNFHSVGRFCSARSQFYFLHWRCIGLVFFGSQCYQNSFARHSISLHNQDISTTCYECSQMSSSADKAENVKYFSNMRKAQKMQQNHSERKMRNYLWKYRSIKMLQQITYCGISNSLRTRKSWRNSETDTFC